MSNIDRVYTWDEKPIEKPNEGGYIELPPGEYDFHIVKFERGRHEGSAKLPPCPKAIVHCAVDGGPLGSTIIKTNLFLHSKCDGLLAQFFASIGLRKRGEPLVLAWDKIVGAGGRCRVAQREYNGKTYNEIARFIDIDDKDQLPF
jgi:hypothetical protein